MEKEVAIVTGASSGLGREIAKLLAEEGMVVYSVARRKEMLMELKKECSKFNGEIKVIPGDLTKEDFREKLVSEVLRESKKIDYLINNAGYGKIGSFEKIEYKDIEGMYALNSIAGEHLTQLALPGMRKRKSGRIINVASVVAFVPPAYFSVYNATKASIYNFSKSLSYELVGSGVSVSVLFPARMDTPFWIVAFKCRGLTGENQKICVREWTKNSIKPMKVAKYLIRNLDSEKLILLPGFLPKFYYYFVKNVPFLNGLVMKYVLGPKTKNMLGK